MATFPVTSGLKCLLDARTLALSDGATVSTWADQSGNSANATVPTGFVGPIFKANVIGTTPAVRFNSGATNQALQGSYSGWGTNGYSHFLLLASVGTSQSDGRVLSFGQTGSWEFGTGGGAITQWGSGAFGRFDSNSSTLPPFFPWFTGPTVIGIHVSGTRRGISINGTEVYAETGTYGLAAIGKYVIGQHYNLDAYAGNAALVYLSMKASLVGYTTATQTMDIAQHMLTEAAVARGPFRDPLSGGPLR